MRKFEVLASELVLSGFFHEYIHDVQELEHDIDELQILTSWKRLLFSEADLLLDISYERWEELFQIEPMFRMLEKSSQGGGSKIQFLPGIIKSLTETEIINEFPSLICLTEKETDILSLENGRLFLSQREMKSTGKILFNNSIFLVSKVPSVKNTLKSWEELATDVIPLTDIVIIDNYLLNHEGLENLISIIKGIIPDRQSAGPIKISILTGLFKDTPQQIKDKGNLWYSEFTKQIRAKIKNLSFEVSLGIFSNISLNHDRSLLTNYIWIDSDHGFNCFTNRGIPKVTTTIKLLPIFSPSGNHKSSVSSFDCWSELRNHAKSLIKKCDFTIGIFKNNLLLK